jgi:competence/damage-inducible domain protein
MRIKLPHSPYIAYKIAIDLLKSGFVTLNSGVEPVAAAANEIISADLQKEKALEERVNEVLAQNEDEMETMQIDRKSMFWLVKKKLAKEFGVILEYEDRFSNVAHCILQATWKKGLIDYSVSENRIKNIIYGSIESYLKIYETLQDEVIEKMEGYKRKLIPGTEEYELVFERLYEDELRKRGML